MDRSDWLQLSTPTPHYTSPTSPEFAIDYPKLPDSLMFKFPPISEREERASPIGSFEEAEDYDDAFNSANSSLDSIDSGVITPPDEHDLGLGTMLSKTYHLEGAEDDGAYEIDRTIIRANLASRSRFDLSRSLGKLATRSSATLRSMSSFPSFARSSGSGSGSGSGSSTPPDSELDGLAAPPTSRLTSRRPSLATGSLAPSLSSPVSPTDVMRSLRKIASTLNLRDCTGPGVERHFEEEVDYYERAWPREDTLEVRVTRTEETVARLVEEDADFVASAQGFGFGFGRPDGVGLYAGMPRERRTTLRSGAVEAGLRE